MNHREAIGGNLPERLHVHRRIVGLALAAIAWTLAAVWILFSHSYYGPLLFGVVTLLVLMFVALPWILLRLGRGREEQPSLSFREWTHGRFETANGPITAGEAAVMILLLPTTIAVGMTAFGLIEFLSAEGIV
jgi:hypothetical protein